MDRRCRFTNRREKEIPSFVNLITVPCLPAASTVWTGQQFRNDLKLPSLYTARTNLRQRPMKLTYAFDLPDFKFTRWRKQKLL